MEESGELEFGSSIRNRRASLVTKFSLFLGAALASFVLQGSIESIADGLYINRPTVALFVLIITTLTIVMVLGAGFYGVQTFLEYGGRLDSIKIARASFEVGSSGFAGLRGGDGSPDAAAEEAASPADISRDPMVIVERMRLRLIEEIEAQGAKANVNLAAGLVTALAAVGFLVWLSYETAYVRTADGAGNIEPIRYWGAFLAKIGLSVTANVFAFFFLSTYRRNLGEIKYFQNELTNVESKVFAVLMAAEKSLNPVLTKALYSLSASERNFILRKGQTTVDLQMKEFDREEVRTMSSALADLVKATMPKGATKPDRQS
jgi:hypothetical protein